MNNNMHIIKCKDEDELSRRAALMVAETVHRDPHCVLGLATGSSPVGMYKTLAKLCKEGTLDFSKVHTFNLDEYYPIQPEDPQRSRYFMNDNFFDHINIDKANTHVPHGDSEDPAKVCEAYDLMIQAAGGIDLQVLGIGNNGHIAFNEPSDHFPAGTHIVDLQESTIKANARFFASEDEVPRQAITMGIGSIMRAKRIILLASGEAKAEAVRACVEGPITPACPASALQLHPDVTLFVDEAAAQLLTK